MPTFEEDHEDMIRMRRPEIPAKIKLARKLRNVDVWNTPTGELRNLFAEAAEMLERE